MALVPTDGNTPFGTTPFTPGENNMVYKGAGSEEMPNVPISLFIAYLYEQLEIIFITGAIFYHTYTNF